MNITKRLYDDFLRPQKFSEYESIISMAKQRGYEFHTILSFESVLSKGIDPNKKYLILRRDVDTSDNVAIRKFLEIEMKYGAKATYYFRWNTINKSIINDIAIGGAKARIIMKRLQPIVIDII